MKAISYYESAKALEEATSRTAIAGGKSHLFFGGTAYLGLNRHPEFINLFIEGIKRYGINNGTSRTNNVQLGIYDQAEEYVAAKFGFHDAILLSSGFLAAQLAVRHLAKDYQAQDILYSPFSHPALWLNQNPNVKGTFEEWAEQTVHRINQSSSQQFLVISNSFDNIIPQRFNFNIFKEIHPDKQVQFIVDDSHGLGIFHPDRTTIASQLIPNHLAANLKLCVVASMAKGLGIDAGAILTDSHTVNKLRQTGVFIGASPTAPAFLYAFLQGEKIYHTQWDKLQENINHFTKRLPQTETWQYLSGYPVFHKPGTAYAKKLAERSILISSFPYPDPSDQPLDRIVLNAAHSREDLEILLSIL